MQLMFTNVLCLIKDSIRKKDFKNLGVKQFSAS
jgi:hypothetical protein